MKEEFLEALYAVIGHKRKAEESIVKVFNPKDRSDTKKRLRKAWEAFDLDAPSVETVRYVLRTCEDTALVAGAGSYYIRRVPKLGMDSAVCLWAFVRNDTGPEAFLLGLRAAMNERRMPIADVYKLIDGDMRLMDLACSCITGQVDPISEPQLYWLLRTMRYKLVNGFRLTRDPYRRWLFISALSV